jgi:N utilization substance protein B
LNVEMLLRQTVTDLPEFNLNDIEKTEVIEHDAAVTERSVARRIALQALYELDCADHNIGEVIDARVSDSDEVVTKKSARYVERLVLGVTKHQSQLDNLIRHYASEWPLDQVAIVDRNILRMAIYEYAVQTTMPESVIIAEAIELAKLFGSESTPRFVNGVLGALASDDQEKVRQLLSPENEG